MSKRNLLSPNQAEAVGTWLEETWPDIERQKLSRDQAAGLCAASVGFRVTPANVASVCRRIGKAWPAEPTGNQKLGYRVHLLKQAIAHLYRVQGITAPNDEVARLLQIPTPTDHQPSRIDQPALPETKS